MQIISEEIGPRSNREQYAAMAELASHPAWQEDMLPAILKAKQHHTDEATNPELSPQARAEHIEAIHALHRLSEYPQRRMAELNAQWKSKPTTQA